MGIRKALLVDNRHPVGRLALILGKECREVSLRGDLLRMERDAKLR